MLWGFGDGQGIPGHVDIVMEFSWTTGDNDGGMAGWWAQWSSKGLLGHCLQPVGGEVCQ